MTGPERKWRIDTWVFVAFVAVITAIGVLFTLAHIFKAVGWPYMLLHVDRALAGEEYGRHGRKRPGVCPGL